MLVVDSSSGMTLCRGTTGWKGGGKRVRFEQDEEGERSREGSLIWYQAEDI